jgi:hypothetical protein
VLGNTEQHRTVVREFSESSGESPLCSHFLESIGTGNCTVEPGAVYPDGSGLVAESPSLRHLSLSRKTGGGDDPNNMGDDAAESREIEVGVVECETVKRYCYCNRRADGSSGQS